MLERTAPLLDSVISSWLRSRLPRPEPDGRCSWVSLCRVTRPAMYRMFATGSMMGAATAYRVGYGCLELWYERAPRLMRLGFETCEPTARSAAAQAEFRDEMIAMARDYSEVALYEMRRGIDDLDAFTDRWETGERWPWEETRSSERGPSEVHTRRRRPHKVKP